MPVEVNTLMSLLQRVEDARRRQREEALRQPPVPPEMPEWSKRLNPDDFKGATRDMLLKAQAAAPNADMPGMDMPGLMQAGQGIEPQTVNRAAMGDRLDVPPMQMGVPGGFSGGYGAATGLVQPPEPEPVPEMPEDANVAPAALQAPQNINLRREFEPHVGGEGGAFIDMARQYRRTGELPGGGGMNRPPAQVAAGAAPQPAGGRGGTAPSQVNDAARAGMSGGGGPGLGYMIGGLGALLQEAGGQQGAMGSFVERYQARMAQAQELARFNKTVDSALKMGIDPDYVMTVAEGGDMGELYKAIHEERKFERDSGKPTDEMREYQLYKEQGGTLPFYEYKKELKRSGAISVDARNMGNIPPGYRVQYDEQGNPVQMAPIPGGPVDREERASQEMADSRRQQQAVYGDMVIKNLDTAINRLTESKVPLAGMASLAAGVPGTPHRDLLGNIKTIRANVGFERLQQMRNSSPTGGALGQVSDKENELLQATQGDLDMAQTREQLINNLVRLRNNYLDTVHGPPEHIAEMARQGRISPEQAAELSQRQELPFDDFGNPRGQAPQGGPQPGQPQSQPPPGVDPNLWQYMTPEERKLWQ